MQSKQTYNLSNGQNDTQKIPYEIQTTTNAKCTKCKDESYRTSLQVQKTISIGVAKNDFQTNTISSRVEIKCKPIVHIDQKSYVNLPQGNLDLGDVDQNMFKKYNTEINVIGEKIINKILNQMSMTKVYLKQPHKHLLFQEVCWTIQKLHRNLQSI